jgi:hypothetical protein
MSYLLKKYLNLNYLIKKNEKEVNHLIEAIIPIYCGFNQIELDYSRNSIPCQKT